MLGTLKLLSLVGLQNHNFSLAVDICCLLYNLCLEIVMTYDIS